MGSPRPIISISKDAIVERAIRRIHEGVGIADTRFENAAALVVYLYESGICDEDELVELARLADGKRYDPVTGIFN